MTFQLKLVAPPKPFLADGPLLLELNLRNIAEAPAQVPVSQGPSPFEYLLLSADGTTTLQSLSHHKKAVARSRGLVPRPVPKQQTLPPGQVTFYRDNLADLLLTPIAPGRYQLEAIYRLPDNGLIRSNKVPIEVLAARPAASVQGMDFRGAQFNAYEFQPRGENQLELRKWQSTATVLTAGQFCTLPVHVQAADVSGLSLAIPVEASSLGQWQWVAWTRGDQIHAEVTRALDTRYASGWVATGLSKTSLVDNGFQFADGHGLFVVSGETPEGAKVRLLSAPADPEQSAQWIDVRLESMPISPMRASLYLRGRKTGADDFIEDPQGLAGNPLPAGTGTTGPEAIVDDDDSNTPIEPVGKRSGKHELLLSWVPRSAPTTGFAVSRISPETGAVIDAPRLVWRADRLLVAHACPPAVVEDIPNAFTFLFAPESPGGAFSFLSVDAHDMALRHNWDLPPLLANGSSPVLPDRWILAYGHGGPATAMAVLDHHLWVVRENSGWRATGLSVADAGSPVRLWILPSGEYWASWHDNHLGLQFHHVA